MADTANPHPIDDFLQKAAPAVVNPELRQALRVQTTRVLRRRRWWRRTRLTGALAACYLAGILTMRVAAPAPAPPPEISRQPTPPTLPDEPERVEAPRPTVEETALALEWRAFEATEHRAELYRQAGDRYLERERDPSSALRCYRQALNATPPENLAISPSDSWLLMTLKEARLKEKDHARNGS
jgi:hypothetical protein